MNLKDVQKHKKTNRGGLANTYSYESDKHYNRLTFFDHKEMIVGVHINTKHKFWNDTKEVLLDAVYKGYEYRMGLDKFKSERSLVLRINNFVKHIVNDTATFNGIYK